MIGKLRSRCSGQETRVDGDEDEDGSKNSSIKSANGYNNDMLISLVAITILLLFLRSTNCVFVQLTRPKR